MREPAAEGSLSVGYRHTGTSAEPARLLQPECSHVKPLTLERLSDLIGDIYDAMLDPSLWEPNMTRLGEAFNASKTNLIMQHSGQPETGLVRTTGWDPELQAEYEPRREREDFWYIAGLSTSEGSIVTGSELVEHSWMRKTPIYNEICRPLEVEYLIAAIIEQNPSRHTFISFLRHHRSDDFDTEERRALALLAPHFKRAHTVHERLATLSLHRNSLSEAADHAPFGVMLLSLQGRVFFANRFAENLLRDDDGISMKSYRLHFHRHDDAAAFEKLMAALRAGRRGDALHDCSGGRLSIHRPSGDAAYQLVLCPTGNEPNNLIPESDAAAVVFLHDPTAKPRISPDSLKATYALTNAEARLCQRLASGQTLAEAADEAGTTVATARTHLKRVFQKCGVGSQSALIQLLLLGSRD